MHLKGADSMAVSGLSFRKALVGSGWATAILLWTNGLRKQYSCPAQHPFYPKFLGDFIEYQIFNILSVS